MRLKLLLVLFLSFGCYVLTNAQVTLSGTLLDAERKQPLPYVNIGIKARNIGTTSRTDGSFSIRIPAENGQDTLTFSLVGYEELNLPISSINEAEQHTYLLMQKVTLL